MAEAIFYGLRSRLLFLVAVTILPLLGLQAFSAAQVRGAASERIRSQIAGDTESAAAEQSRLLRRADRLLGNLADGSWVAARDPEVCGAEAREILAEEPSFLNLGAIDLQGRVFCSALPNAVGPIVADHRHFQRALAERRFVAGDLQTELGSGKPSLELAGPVLQGQSMVAVAFIALDIGWMERFAQAEHFLPEATVSAFDAQGVVLGRYPDATAWIGRSTPALPLVRTAVAQQIGFIEESALDGAPRLYAFYPFERVPDGSRGYLALGFPPEALFGDIDRIFQNSLALMAAAAALALVAASFFAGALVLRPIAVVLKAARSLAGGDLGARTGNVHPRGELGRLHAAFDEMADSLERNEERIRQMEKMEAIGQLAGGIAHDFNNLLTAVMGFSSLLAGRLAGQEPLHGYAQEIHKAAERGAGLTQQLLGFSRRQVLQPEVADVNAILGNMQSLLRRVIQEDIELVLALASDLGQANVDRNYFEQAILNMATNARDAMPTGGRLTLETANVDLGEDYVSLHPLVSPGRYVMVAVTDTGVGMDEETRKHVFEPFFTTKEVGKGTGLGLAGAHGFVRQSAGALSVYSEPGHGTTFKIYLPRVEAAGAKVGEEESPRDAAGGHETILVAEDEEPVRELVITVLKSAGYTVLYGATAMDALQVGEQYLGPIDLLLTDVVMPELQGPELARRLTALRPHLRVLFMSGYPGRVAGEQYDLADAHFLPKPFRPADLRSKVREALDAVETDPVG